MSDVLSNQRGSIDARRAAFLAGAEDYERYRPRYPAAAVEWAIGRRPKRVIDIGCGPGNLTVQMEQLGHDVVGVDPSAAMLKVASRKGLRLVGGAAEVLPFVDACVDVVTAGTAFHWFDARRAVPEIRRILQEDGRVAILTNIRNEATPWVSALSGIIGSEAAMSVTLGGADRMEEELLSRLQGGGFFGMSEHRVFEHEQQLTPQELVGLVCSRSYVAILAADKREQLIANVKTLCREHPDLRGKESFVMPYQTHAFRSAAV